MKTEGENNEEVIKPPKTKDDKESNIRNYRVYITYDMYYHTPRFWLNGNDSNNNPLTKE